MACRANAEHAQCQKAVCGMTYEWHRAEIAVDGPVNPVERLREEAPQAQSNEDLVRRFVEACRRTRTILPATTTIERLCADALVDAERRIEARIARAGAAWTAARPRASARRDGRRRRDAVRVAPAVRAGQQFGRRQPAAGSRPRRPARRRYGKLQSGDLRAGRDGEDRVGADRRRHGGGQPREILAAAEQRLGRASRSRAHIRGDLQP